MFTGLVQAVGRVAEVRPLGSGTGAVRIVVDPAGWAHEAALGDSICISGCCLTVADAPAGPDAPLAFDAVPETLRLTTLGRLALGAAALGMKVNLERSVTPATLLGGHLVQGHVEGVGRVVRVQREERGDWRVRIQAPGAPDPALIECITPKGAITVEGVSLTVAAVEGDCFEVALIPTTLEATTLGELQEGDGVNLETDILARTVVHWLRTYAPARWGAGSQPAPAAAAGLHQSPSDPRAEALGRWRGGGGGG